MVHGDIMPYNFLIDPKTLQVTIANFGYFSALPHSFVDFTLHSTKNKFVVGIAKSLDWAHSDNLPALREAARTYRPATYNAYGRPPFCLTLESELMMAIDLDKDGLRATKTQDRQRGGKSGPRRTPK